MVVQSPSSLVEQMMIFHTCQMVVLLKTLGHGDVCVAVVSLLANEGVIQLRRVL